MARGRADRARQDVEQETAHGIEKALDGSRASGPEIEYAVLKDPLEPLSCLGSAWRDRPRRRARVGPKAARRALQRPHGSRGGLLIVILARSRGRGQGGGQLAGEPFVLQALAQLEQARAGEGLA